MNDMRCIQRIAGAILGLCMITSTGANAKDVDGQELADIRAQQTEYLADAQAGEGLFEELTEAERTELVGYQTRLLALIEGKDNVLDLSDADQVEAFNLLEQINATVTLAEGKQVICELRAKTGSHRKVKVCMTVAEREQMREDSRRVLEKGARGYCAGPPDTCIGG